MGEKHYIIDRLEDSFEQKITIETAKRIDLTQDYYTIVDEEDYERLVAMGKWYALKKKHHVYAVRSVRLKEKRPLFIMHRVIMEAKDGQIVDHINRDGLDNRKANLRICSHAENIRNQIGHSMSFSKFKGVVRHKNAWQSQIGFAGKYIYLGRFENEVDAAKAYDEAAKDLHGEFARLNFPE